MNHSHTETAAGIMTCSKAWEVPSTELAHRQCSVAVCSLVLSHMHSFREIWLRGDRTIKKMASTIYYQQIRSFDKRLWWWKVEKMKSWGPWPQIACLKPAKGNLGTLDDIIEKQDQYSAKRMHSFNTQVFLYRYTLPEWQE